jgi:Flp pilus assembly protein TadD
MELRPTEADPYFGAGLCLQAVGDVDGAMIAFRQYVAMDVRPASRTFVEIARKHLGDLERGATVATKTATQAAPPALLEARQQRDHGHLEEAIAHYRSAIAADGKSVDAHAELGALLVSARRAPDAVDVLRTAVRLAPASPPAWYNLAFALRESGKPADAVDAYRRYITFRPKDPDPHFGLGRALVSLGRTDEALASFRRYTLLETRPTERQWLKKARAEIDRIESTQKGVAPPAPPPAIAPPASPASPPSRATPAPPASPPRPKLGLPAAH